MIRLLAPTDDGTDGPLLTVAQAAVSDGAPEPSWIAVEDDRGEWIRHAAATEPVDRARAVVAVQTEAALVAAVRLGVGGAMWLPPSTQGAATAFRAASEAAPNRGHPSAWLADLATGWDGDLLAVSWVNRPFWRCQLGEPFMAGLLVDLADELGVLPALLPWPALLMSPRPERDIHSAWELVTARTPCVTEGLEVIGCAAREGHCGVVTTAMQSLVAHVSEESERESVVFPRPVYGLPSGQLAGWWAPFEPAEPAPERGWLATPHSVSEAGFRWRLEDGAGASRWADDVYDLGAAEDAARIPGWVALSVGAGRPAGLLVERLAGAAEKTGRPLWVPNVDAHRLQFLLRQPDVLWVDGPAVPDDPATGR